jgi:hypothetical protein
MLPDSHLDPFFETNDNFVFDVQKGFILEVSGRISEVPQPIGEEIIASEHSEVRRAPSDFLSVVAP